MNSVVRNALAATLSIAASAGTAPAQQATTIVNLQVSADGINWANRLDLNASSQTQRVLFRTTVSWRSDTLPEPLGFANMVIQPIFGGFRGADSIAPFAALGNNTSGGSVVLDSTPLDGPFGRLSPYAGAGSISADASYIVHVHNGTGGAPPGRYLRIARNDVTRWIGTGPNTIGTAAANNFNGAGGMTIVQKPLGLRMPDDPPFHYATQNIVVLQLGLDIAPTLPGQMLDLSADIPLLAFSRDATTSRVNVGWYRDESVFMQYTAINVIPAAIHIPVPSVFAAASLAAVPLLGRRRRH